VTDPTSEAAPASARANVTEPQVIGEDETATTVELERIVVRDSGDEGDTSSDADTSSETTSEESSTDDSTDDATTSDAATDDATTDDAATDDATNGSDSDGGYQLTPVTELAAGASTTTPRLRRVG